MARVATFPDVDTTYLISVAPLEKQPIRRYPSYGIHSKPVLPS